MFYKKLASEKGTECRTTKILELGMNRQAKTLNKITKSVAAALLMGLSQQALAHVEYFDLNQGAQIGDLTTAGKALSTAQYGANPVVTGGGVGVAANTTSDRALNDTALWNAGNQTYKTGVGSFSNAAINTVNPSFTGNQSYNLNTVIVNDVTDFGWGAGTQAALGDTHKVDFFNFRLTSDADVTITWNVGNSTAYYDSAFSLYTGVASYQAHDDAIDQMNPKSGLPSVKVQNAFDTGTVADAQGNISAYRNTLTNTTAYIGQFDALHSWGDGNQAGNWSNVGFITAVHVLRGAVGANGYSLNAADTKQTLTMHLTAGNYTIAASGALGAPGSQASFGQTNQQGVLTYSVASAVPAAPAQVPAVPTVGLGIMALALAGIGALRRRKD